MSSTQQQRPRSKSHRKPLGAMQSLLRKTIDTFSPLSSQTSVPKYSDGTDFLVAPNEKALFPVVDPAVDGEDCEHDCESCTIHYPAKFSIDEDDKLYGHVKGWSTHVLVATGKSDWVRSVEDEKGSVMEAIGKAHKPANGNLMLSASNIPIPESDTPYAPKDQPTSVLLLPSFTVIESVTPSSVPDLINHVISSAPTNTTPFAISSSSSNATSQPPIPFPHHDCPHNALILLCSQKTRDARCGQSAPLLRRELERHLRPLGLYRDLHDTRPGGVGIYFISHVGGHKYSANVMVYRRGGSVWDKYNENNTTPPEEEQKPEQKEEQVEEDKSAAQCIWLARVRPEDCEGLVKYTVLQGKVRKPSTQLRGGFDRQKGVVSW